MGERGNSATAATNSPTNSASGPAANSTTSPVVSTAGPVPGSGNVETDATANAPASGVAASQQRSDGNEERADVAATTRPTLSEQIAQRLQDQQSDQGNEASAVSELTGNPQRTQRA